MANPHQLVRNTENASDVHSHFEHETKLDETCSSLEVKSSRAFAETLQIRRPIEINMKVSSLLSTDDDDDANRSRKIQKVERLEANSKEQSMAASSVLRTRSNSHAAMKVTNCGSEGGLTSIAQVKDSYISLAVENDPAQRSITSNTYLGEDAAYLSPHGPIHNEEQQNEEEDVYLQRQQRTRNNRAVVPAAVRVRDIIDHANSSEFDSSVVSTPAEGRQDPVEVEIVTDEELHDRLKREILQGVIEAEDVQPIMRSNQVQPRKCSFCRILRTLAMIFAAVVVVVVIAFVLLVIFTPFS